jgi:cyclopropane fatty-acyl-phospholipid synthase-like methyltransferase
MNLKVDSKFYSREYFLSESCEGFSEFKGNLGLSFIKQRELEILNPQPNDRILDVGCGRGEFLYYCCQKGLFVTGIDYSKDAIDLALELFKAVDKGKYDFMKLDIVTGKPIQKFNKILMADVIEHLSWNDARAALKNSLETLKDDGVMLIHTSPNTWFTRRTFPLIKPILKLLNKKEILRQMQRVLSITSQCHVNEFNYISLKKIIRSLGIKNYKIWLSKDLLRGGISNYTKEISQSKFFKLVEKILSLKPFIYFFSNDLFVLIKK